MGPISGKSLSAKVAKIGEAQKRIAQSTTSEVASSSTYRQPQQDKPSIQQTDKQTGA